MAEISVFGRSGGVVGIAGKCYPLPMIESVTFSDGAFEFRTASTVERVDAADIKQIDRCTMKDAALHGDEEFHIFHLADTFWLIGPFVSGALKAVSDFIRAQPDTPSNTVIVQDLPWAFRKPGFLGLRFFATPGFVKMPAKRLQALRLRVED